MSDAVVEIDLEWKSKGTSHVQKMKGTVQEIAREVKKLDTSKFNRSLKISQKDLDSMSTTIKKNGNLFTKMGNKAVLSARMAKKEYKQLHELQFKKSNNSYWKVENGKKIRVTKQQYQEYKKLNKEITTYNQKVKQSGYYEGVKVKRTQNATKSNLAMVASMNKILRAAQSKAYITYNQQIKKMSAEMDKAKVSASEKAKVLKELENQMHRLSRMDISSISNSIIAGGGDEHTARQVSSQFTDGLKEQQHAVKTHVGKMRELQSHLQGLKQMILGGVGFTMIDIGGVLQETFSNKRLGGSVSGAASSLASSVGSIFGELPGAVMGDLGKAAGNIAEGFFNIMTFSFRSGMIALGGFLKGFGTGLLGVAFSPLKTGALAIGSILGGVLGMIQSTLAVWKETLAEMMDLAKKLMTAVISIFSAGFKIVGSVFKSVWSVISTTWSNIWKGMKDAVKNTLDFTLNAISKMTQASLSAFAKQEALSTKAAKETLGTRGSGSVQGMGNLARKTAGAFGTDVADTQEALFDVVSSGYQKMSEANSILSASARLAKQDSSTVANATNALITIYQNYGDQIKSVAKVSDILSAATTVGRTSLTEMGPALKSVIPIARVFNVQLEDVMVSISALTRIFGRGSTTSATRYLSRFFESIAQPSAAAKKELQKLGISLDMIQKKGGVLEAFRRVSAAGPETLRKFLPTIQARRASALSTDRGQQVFKSTQKQFTASLGGGSKKLALEQDTLANRMQKVGAVASSLKAKFGGLLSDVIKFTFFNKYMNKLWQDFSSMLNSSKLDKTLSRVGNIAKSILLPVSKSVLQIFKSIVSAFKNFALGDFLDNRAFVSFSLELKYLSDSVWNFLKTFDPTRIIDFGVKTLNVFKDVIKWTRILSDWMLKGFDNFKQKVSPILSDVWSGFRDTASNAFDRVLDKASNFIAGLADILVNGDFDVTKMFIQIPDSLKTFFTVALKSVEILFLKTFHSIGSVITKVFSSSTNQFVKLMKSGIRVIMTNLKEMLTVFEAINGWSSPLDNITKRGKAIKFFSEETGAKKSSARIADIESIMNKFASGKGILTSVTETIKENKKLGKRADAAKLTAFLHKIGKVKFEESKGRPEAAAKMRKEILSGLGFDKDDILTAKNIAGQMAYGR